MSANKPINPYTTLRDAAKAFVRSVLKPHRVKMAWWKEESLPHIDGKLVYERTMAAQQLGMRVEVKADDEGLHFWYVSQPDEGALPWSLR